MKRYHYIYVESNDCIKSFLFKWISGSLHRVNSRLRHQHTIEEYCFINSGFKPAGSEFFSTSTDGTVLWWDARKLNEPTERLDLIVGKTGAEKLGGTALEFESTMVRRNGNIANLQEALGRRLCMKIPLGVPVAYFLVTTQVGRSILLCAGCR